MQTGQIEEGRVSLPAQVERLDVFLSELRAFPRGRHDDQIDGLTEMLEWSFNDWRRLAKRRTPEGGSVDKAMRSAYQYAVLQTFYLPRTQQEDADARSNRLLAPEVPAAPREG